MPLHLTDRVPVKWRETADGNLVAHPRIARTGIQIYHGTEVGRPDLELVRVYRPEDEVFAADAVRSYAHKPITLDHPKEPVTPDNWMELSRGHSGDEVLRDGKFARVPMLVMDAKAIKAIKSGERDQISVGYACDLKWEAGKTEDGEAYDAVQHCIRANHIALVKSARGGPELRFGDALTCPKCGEDMEGNVCPSCGYTLEEDAKSGDFIKVGPDKYKRKGGKGKTYNYAQVQKYYASGGWDSAGILDFNEKHFGSGPKGGQFAPKEGGDDPNEGDDDEENLPLLVSKLKKSKIDPDEKADYLESLSEAANKKNKKELKELMSEISAHIAGTEDSADPVVTADDLDIDDDKEGEKYMAKLTIDAISVEMTDTAVQVVEKAIGTRDKRISDMGMELEELNKKKKKIEEDSAAALATAAAQLSDAKAAIAAHEAKQKDNEITPAKLDQLVVDRVAVIGKAKTLLGDKLVVDGKSNDEIRKQVVDARMGDAAKGYDANQIRAAFEAFAVVTSANDGVNDIARSFGQPGVVQQTLGDAREKAYADYTTQLESRWKGKAA